ncbi:DUF2304 domain-containing protein [Candidatus Uhrbacteria bacterium]|nr:DUF2304 domain-containing protein [Candidatus Uhrbacteria bacterium]
MTIQILITAVSAVIIGKALSKLKRREVHGGTCSAWILFWIAVIALVWQPNLTNYLAYILQVTRGADAIFYLSLVGIFYLLFRIFIRLERMDQEITTIVREIALLKNRKDIKS